VARAQLFLYHLDVLGRPIVDDEALGALLGLLGLSGLSGPHGRGASSHSIARPTESISTALDQLDVGVWGRVWLPTELLEASEKVLHLRLSVWGIL